MTWGTDGPEPRPAPLQDRSAGAEVPLDYLVRALSQAVARRIATRRNETEDRT